MMPQHICIYCTRINHYVRSPEGYRLALGYSLGGPLRTHRAGFSFSGEVKDLIGFPVRHPTPSRRKH